jgi:hypothetical protein
VLTENGTTGYCFSYRLRLFEHSGGALAAQPRNEEAAEDPELERLLSRRWSAESYWTMLNARRLDIDELSQAWGFDPGLESGLARIRVRELDRTFSYTAIKPSGTRGWRFEGSSLTMTLRSDTVLAVQFTENGGALRTFLFVALPTEPEDLIIQETARRGELYHMLFSQGPAFTSHNYGTITLTEDGRFTWQGYELLIPQVIPASALGSGVVNMRLFLAASLTDRYAGACTLYFNRTQGAPVGVNFMYSLDSQGFRLEYAPESSMDGVTVVRRASSPLVLYFYKAEVQASPYQGAGAAPLEDF